MMLYLSSVPLSFEVNKLQSLKKVIGTLICFSHEFVPIMFQKNEKKKWQENHLIIIFLESKHVII